MCPACTFVPERHCGQVLRCQAFGPGLRTLAALFVAIHVLRTGHRMYRIMIRLAPLLPAAPLLCRRRSAGPARQSRHAAQAVERFVDPDRETNAAAIACHLL